MQVYLVGGAVRDELLGLSVAERDWVVVGATPEELQQAGYRAVGREFPVFLHPDTHEEYALARVERKTGPGYRGFETRFSPEVTLEQDLQRRDLTINAMARAPEGTLIDPYGGRRDLEQRLLRHVSPAFVEDPVRILRVARFAARLAALGFRLAPDTAALMRRMVDNGEINSLVSERVWREMQRALGEAHPEVFFDVLQDCGALAVLLPELAWRAAERATLQRAARLSAEVSVRFAALLADAALQAVTALCERLRVPNDYRELALLSARLWQRIAGAEALDAAGVLELLEAADAFRRPDRFELLLRAAQARAGTDDSLHAALAVALVTAAGVTLPPEQIAQLKGIAIAAAYRAARIERLQQLQSERRKS
ncbi:MAG TPA: multifunctional CCA tRNA nucleotidyl transferase/2'3'-cyclic phosphodiesterase/2'nucleotidase/phosphatase [Steroidobacteraceae bacterium]|jgi:tRNA nucleotidyltransferase (CCA-adding enzyme)|nr:multifunctional CCA tRNA nucleotidyl transferase/2'3'-cyclic phosphodiesterase/2'nucleotidase/phosphatase [Steroidobacteraceae bacterium]